MNIKLKRTAFIWKLFKNFCNIIHFDHLNASLLNKSISSLKKKKKYLLTHKPLTL